MSKKVTLIQCVSKKHYGTHEARYLYKSPLFQYSYRYAQTLGDPIYILSAEYSLIEDIKIIQSYDTTLNTFSKSQIEEWAKNVASQIDSLGIEEAVLLAGEKYASFCQYTCCKITNPLDGLPIGKRLGWLKNKVESVI